VDLERGGNEVGELVGLPHQRVEMTALVLRLIYES
jgi:hypothetical protein